MTKYIEDTLAALDLKIAMLQKMRASLAATFANWTIEVDAPAPSANGRPAARNKSVRRSSPAPALARSPSGGSRLRQGAEVAINAAAKLPEPFGPVALSKVSGLSKNGSASAILRWFMAGWVRKVAYGKYERTAKFPASGPSAAPPKPAESRAAIQKRLSDALKQRDHARENGRDAIVEIFQKEVEQLEAQLETV